MAWASTSITITTIGGAGNNTFTAPGYLESIHISSPLGSPTLDIEIEDSNKACRDVRTGIQAPCLLKMGNVVIVGTQTFYIANATINGTYTITFYYGGIPF